MNGPRAQNAPARNPDPKFCRLKRKPSSSRDWVKSLSVGKSRRLSKLRHTNSRLYPTMYLCVLTYFLDSRALKTITPYYPTPQNTQLPHCPIKKPTTIVDCRFVINCIRSLFFLDLFLAQLSGALNDLNQNCLGQVQSVIILLGMLDKRAMRLIEW